MNDFDDDGENTSNKNYEVGYGQPPKETQFKPGQSGNPKGRKRKPKSVSEQMHKVLQKKVPITEAGKTKSLPLQEVILRNLANKAAKGDLKAISFVFNLLNSPEFAETEDIDRELLSAEDQAMFEDVMRQLVGDNAPLADEDLNGPNGQTESSFADANSTPDKDAERHDSGEVDEE